MTRAYSLATIALVASGLLSGPAQAADCPLELNKPIVIPAKHTKPGQKPDTEKRAYTLSDGSVVFVGKLTVDADGAPKAYAPNGRGLDVLGDAGSPGNWYGIATDAKHCGETGRPLLQGPTDPAPGFYVSKTTMTNRALNDCRLQTNYVNASIVPYVALPKGIAVIDPKQGTGRLAIVGKVAKGAPEPAIHADAAPTFGIGEASMELVRRLGLNPSPRTGGGDRRDFIYVVFPDRSGFPASAKEVEDKAGAAFQRWGGVERYEACKAAVLALPR
jgi:Fungal chitosanase of glycosyl hydrolase group 75